MGKKCQRERTEELVEDLIKEQRDLGEQVTEHEGQSIGKINHWKRKGRRFMLYKKMIRSKRTKEPVKDFVGVHTDQCGLSEQVEEDAQDRRTSPRGRIEVTSNLQAASRCKGRCYQGKGS